ncbi:MAG: hypothetical protein ACREBH_03675 [Candidatus Micrarchaeaceae archaeon]
MNKAIIAYVAVIIIIIILAYVLTGFKFLNAKSTTIPITVSTTVAAGSTTINSVMVNYSNTISPCSSFGIVGQKFNTTYTAKCSSPGGIIYGLWVAAGDSGYEHVSIEGTGGNTYVTQNSTYNCTTFYENFTLPQGTYEITYITGTGGGSCGNSMVAINTTANPPRSVVYSYIYNGNFSNGEYTGWNLTGKGFGTAPLNISYSESKPDFCYEGEPWSNYIGGYFATTYNCGISVAPGNITSSPFVVVPSKPFLNFKIISPQDQNLYVEILKGSPQLINGTIEYVNFTPVIMAHYNTYNLTVNPNATSSFVNVTIPMAQYINDVAEVKTVAITEQGGDYIAVGDFALSNRPEQQMGIATNITTSN